MLAWAMKKNVELVQRPDNPLAAGKGELTPESLRALLFKSLRFGRGCPQRERGGPMRGALTAPRPLRSLRSTRAPDCGYTMVAMQLRAPPAPAIPPTS